MRQHSAAVCAGLRESAANNNQLALPNFRHFSAL
jgi:hypothetical protein